MGEADRFSVEYVPYVGVGVWWNFHSFDLELSLVIPFVSITIGLGRRKGKAPVKGSE